MLAKICSDKNKPNGQYRIEPTREVVMNFVNMLPIRKVSSIIEFVHVYAVYIRYFTVTFQLRTKAFVSIFFSSTCWYKFILMLTQKHQHNSNLGSTKKMKYVNLICFKLGFQARLTYCRWEVKHVIVYFDNDNVIR